MNRRYIDFVPHQKDHSANADSNFGTETFEYVEASVEKPEIKKSKGPKAAKSFNARYVDNFIIKPHKKIVKANVKEELADDLDDDFDNEPVKEPAEEVIDETAEVADAVENTDDLDKSLTIEEIMLARETKPADDDPVPTSSYGFGLVEDYTPIDSKKSAFISSVKIEKRPLSGKAPEPAKDSENAELEDELKLAKSEDLTKRSLHSEKSAAAKPDDTFKKPKFINTHLVEKRPLSKTDYRNRTPEPTVEESTTPVTIIDKPEKDSRLGFIIAIIITILLGIAVGTVAFLLIPHK